MTQRFVVSLDAGGTMTDTFIVDEEGKFGEVGKALTNREDESASFIESINDAAGYLKLEEKEILSGAITCIYTGTGMLNTILTRTGLKTGLLITKGFEDYLILSRGQRWLGKSYHQIIHFAERWKTEPYVEKKLIKGIGERINIFGEVVIPINKDEVANSVRELMDNGVESIGIVFLNSHINPTHEIEAKNIAMEIVEKEIPIYCSSELMPVIREYSRLYSTLIQCYAAEPVRKQLLNIEEKARKNGYEKRLLTVLSYGGLADVRYPRMFETLLSGPVGGIMGSKYIADIVGLKNIVCCDLGGTSFDVGLVVEGYIPIKREPIFHNFMLNLPMIDIDSIASGTGTVLKIDPISKRIILGPESAGAKVGICYEFDRPTISDCDLILGYLNPDYFIGGKIKLNKKDSENALSSIAEELGVEVYDFAFGVLELLHTQTRGAILSRLTGRGFSPSEFAAIFYGGSGPMHLWGISKNVPFTDVITVPWAAAFSAFGIATADYLHRLHSSTYAEIPHNADDETKLKAGEMINPVWEKLEQEAYNLFKMEGYTDEEVRLKHFVYCRYKGQLEDFEAQTSVSRITKPEDVDKIIQDFEKAYGALYPEAMKFPEAGYLITEVAIAAYVDLPKPKITKYELEGESPKDAYKDTREVYFEDKWYEFNIFEMKELKPGNVVVGPSIIEHPATTLVVPPDNRIRMDEYRLIHFMGR